MVEAASGQTLGEYCQQHLFEPLGMHSTGFVPTPEMSARLLPGYRRTGDDLSRNPPAVSQPGQPEPEFEMGGGGLFSSAADYAKFLRMLLRGGELDGQRVLQSDTVALMAQNHIGQLRVTPLSGAIPALSNDAELFAGEEKSWALTFQRHEQAGFTGRSSGTLMWAGLTNCYFWLDFENEVGGVYLTQVLPFADPNCLDVYYQFEKAVYEELT